MATGLQKLYLLSLDRTPAAELLAGTAQAWLEVLTTGRVWEKERDTPRIRDAFVTLASTREQWPAPRHFIDALQPVRMPLSVGYEVKPLSPEQAAQRMAEIKKMLDEPMPQHDASKVKPEREGPPLAEVEAGLQAHYASTGKMAAAGPDA